jgi:hypothetical protein
MNQCRANNIIYNSGTKHGLSITQVTFLKLLPPGFRTAEKPGIAHEVNGFRLMAEPRQS